MSSDPPIRVLLVDDHDMVRRGLSTFLNVFDDLELVGEARTGMEALRACAERKPDVVVLDLMMPDMDGPTATREIRQHWQDIQVVALTSFPEPQLLHEVLRAGAISYLLKNVTADALHAAIKAAHSGHSTLAPEATQILVQLAAQPPRPGHDLTTREREVLGYLVEGLSNTAIADRLVVSPSTIKSHVSNILTKLEVSNRSEAVALAVRHDLVR